MREKGEGGGRRGEGEGEMCVFIQHVINTPDTHHKVTLMSPEILTPSPQNGVI